MRAFYLAVLVLALAACNREGPAEKAGRSIDRAVEKASKGIETASQREMLVALGYTLGQGHLYAMAMPALEFERAYLEEQVLAPEVRKSA